MFKEPPRKEDGTAVTDGEEVFLTPAMLKASYNWEAVSAGLAYVTFYKGLFHDLRKALAEEAGRAREAGRGVYASDATNAGFNATSLAVITDEVPILPKLFRRLSDYMVNAPGAEGFKEKLRLAREPVLDLVTQNFTHFDNLMEQAGTRISLTRKPEEMVFDETIPQPGPKFAAIVNHEALRE